MKNLFNTPIWKEFWPKLQVNIFKSELWQSAVVLAILFTFWPGIIHQTVNVLSADNYFFSDEFTAPYNLEELELASLGAVVLELPEGQVIGELEPDLELPLASLTKLMTARLVIDQDFPLQNQFKMTASSNSELLKYYRARGDSISYLRVKDSEPVKIYDLLASGLIGSANNSMAALAEASDYSAEEFIRLMNQKADELEFKSTHFADSTGLLPDNTGTAYEIARLAQNTWRNPLLKKLSGLPQIKFKTGSGEWHTIKNTNRLVINPSKKYAVVASKTGYLEEAGSSIVFQIKFKNNKEYIVALLNAPEAGSRVEDVTKVISWLGQRE